jgi:hypothetical protein
MKAQPVYDHYEISGRYRLDDAEKDGRRFVETCDDDEAQFWTLYGHINGEGVEAIANFRRRDAAEQVFYRITGQPFTGSYQAGTRLRLMHAAPALLEALKSLAGQADEDCPAEYRSRHFIEALDTARELIAEVTHTLPVARSPLEITEDEFDGRFPLVTNHLNPNASWGSGNEGGCLFETYGEELEFVRRQDPRTVWTLDAGDGDDQYLVSGFHFVNRVGYLVSTVPLPEELEVEVRIPNGHADDPEADEAGEA